MNGVTKTAVLLVGLMIAANGICAEEKAPAAATETTKQAAQPAEAVPAGHPAMPADETQESANKPATITGKVLETMDAGGYTYVLLETGGEKKWLAVSETKMKVGETRTFGAGNMMSNFNSRSLKRTFEWIIFTAPLDVPKEEPKMPKAGDKSPGSKGALVAGSEKISVEKASGENAYTVAELYEKSKKLDKKTVVVRGKVVKVSAGIMERNWIHIQDGTGSKKKGTNNLVVTSEIIPEIGDVVTVTGTLAKDRDFGSGYRYNVIIEKASIKK